MCYAFVLLSMVMRDLHVGVTLKKFFCDLVRIAFRVWLRELVRLRIKQLFMVIILYMLQTVAMQKSNIVKNNWHNLGQKAEKIVSLLRQFSQVSTFHQGVAVILV